MKPDRFELGAPDAFVRCVRCVRCHRLRPLHACDQVPDYGRGSVAWQCRSPAPAAALSTDERALALAAVLAQLLGDHCGTGGPAMNDFAGRTVRILLAAEEGHHGASEAVTGSIERIRSALKSVGPTVEGGKA